MNERIIPGVFPLKKVDYHLHLERGPLSRDYLQEFIDAAQQREIAELGFAEHSFRFRQFRDCFRDELRTGQDAVGRIQQEFLDTEFRDDLGDYVDLIRSAQAEGLPIRLGIEVDYFPGQEQEIASILGEYDWDYITGAVHFVEGWGFDFPADASRRQWEGVDVDRIYADFFHLLIQAAAFGPFDLIAHPDNIKVYGYRPTDDLHPRYEEVARVFARQGLVTEVNTGLLYRYPVEEICPHREFLTALAGEGVQVTLASDAHRPADCGRFFERAREHMEHCGVHAIWSL